MVACIYYILLVCIYYIIEWWFVYIILLVCICYIIGWWFVYIILLVCIYYIIGWWFVYKNEGDECGYVPASFLKKLGDSEAPMSPTDTRDILGFVFSLTHDQEATSTVAPVLSYTALDDYETDDTRQLSFPVGAVLTIIEKSEDGKRLPVHLTIAANMGTLSFRMVASIIQQSKWVGSIYIFRTSVSG